MGKYIIRRVLQMIIVILGITVISFTIMQLAPGDPVDILAGRTATPEQKAHIKQLYGLDRPIIEQYFSWVSRVFKGDFGHSYISGKSVLKMILERMPATLILNFWAMIIIYLLAIPIGMISALRQYSWFDYIVTTFAFLVRAMPAFYLALLLVYFIGMRIEGIQIAGMATYGFNWGEMPFYTVFRDRLSYIALPLIVLSFGGMAGITRFMRASMLDVIHQDYVRTARAKGLPERKVITRHAMRNALLPIVTLIGFELPILFSGSVIIETIFSWPGIGLLAVNSIFQRDYLVIMAFNLMGAIMTVIGMFLADMLYLVADPRIKYN